MSKPEDLTILDYKDLVRQYHNESDRAAAVLAGSYAEHFIGKYLRCFMIDDINEGKLFDGSGPFATFAQRINTAYAFNFIDKNMRNDLLYVKKIRNHFAHYPKETSFKSNKISPLCKNLTTAQPIKIRGSNETYTATNPREQYIIAIGVFIISAHNRMLARQKQRKTKKI